MNRTIVILGDSPFLKEVEDKVNYVLYRYPSIGINRAIIKYETSMHSFVDIGMLPIANRKPKIKKITLPLYKDVVKGDKEIFGTFSFSSYGDIINNKGELAWCGFTHDYAISYAIYKGYERIILLGVADFVEGGHYSCHNTFTYSNSLREMSKKFISEFCIKKTKIYTCNKNSCLQVPYLPIEELLT